MEYLVDVEREHVINHRLLVLDAELQLLGAERVGDVLGLDGVRDRHDDEDLALLAALVPGVLALLDDHGFEKGGDSFGQGKRGETEETTPIGGQFVLSQYNIQSEQ